MKQECIIMKIWENIYCKLISNIHTKNNELVKYLTCIETICLYSWGEDTFQGTKSIILVENK